MLTTHQTSGSPAGHSRLVAATLCALGVAGCSLGGKKLDEPPSARGIVIANKVLLWRNTDSIRNAAIAPPQRQAGLWQVCVRMNVKGPLGYASQRDFLVALNEGSKSPELIMTDATAVCATQPYVPFPELDGSYETNSGGKRGIGRK